MTHKTDILVIGGGAIGLSTAYYLLKAGRGVTVIDQHAVAAGSSSGNAGHIVPSHIVPLAAPGIIGTALGWMLDPQNSPFGMRVSVDPAYLAWLLAFAGACSEANVASAIPALKALGLLSAANVARMIAEERFDCVYSPGGLLFLYKTEKAFAGGQHEADLLHRHGLPADALDAKAVHEREPAARADVIGGVHFTSDASLDPGRFLRALADWARGRGAELREHTPVTGFDTSGDRVTRVRTTAGDIEAECVVLATGAWSPLAARGLGLTLPVQPARGYSLTAKAPAIMPRQALLLGERRVAVTPMGERLRITGRLELSTLDTTPSPQKLAGIERAVREYIALDEPLDVLEIWAGLRPTTPDGVPIIGRSPRHKNLIVATGHAMLGLSLGPGTGQVVSELVTGREPSMELGRFAVEWSARR